MERRRSAPALLMALALTAALVGCGGGSVGDDGAATDDTGSGADTDDGGSGTSADSGGDGDAAEEGEPVPGGEVIYGIISDSTGFNVLEGLGEGAGRIVTALSDPLVAYNADGELVPHALESFESNDDATVWTLTLRDGITFHDGAPLDAEAMRANFQAFKDSPSVGFALGRVSSFEVVDELTVEVTMTAPWAAFPHVLVGGIGSLVSPDTIGTSDDFVGIGPFVLDSWTPGDGAVAVRNENYWRADEGLPYLDRITFKVINDQASRRQALEAGDIDAYYAPGDADVLDFQAGGDIVFHQNTGETNEGLYILNTTRPPTDDVRVRRALALAIDRELLIENFRSGLTEPASSFISPDSPWYVATDYPGYDPEAAAALVEEYEAEVGPISFELTASNAPEVIEVAEVVISFWSDAGIDVSLVPIQPGTEVPVVIADDFNAIAWAQFSAIDPDGEYIFFHSSGGALNWSNLVDERIDDGFEMARTSFDDGERKEGYALVQEALADQVPMLWIDHFGPVEGVASSPDVHGFLDQHTVDGEPSWGFGGGSYFRWTEIWKG